MINELKNMALGFCAAAVFLGALSFFAPSGNMKKPVKYAFSLVFLLFCTGLFSVFGKFSGKIPETPAVQADTGISESYAEYLCEAVMKDAGLSYKKITVKTNINENGGIYISEIRIITAEPKAAVEKAVKSQLETEKLEVVNE